MTNSNPGDACANLKVGFGAIAFKFLVDGLRYDKSMERNIANEFNKNILCPEEQLPRPVVDQLLMLTFSFAVRLLMSIEFGLFPSIVEWQMETLLSAYKILSTKSDVNGIFPFKIIQCSADISHWYWTESEYTAEHKQYIQNFKFVLKLSDFSLTSFEVYKLLETIIIDVETMEDISNVRAVEQQPPALYTFVKQYFVEKLGKKTLKHFWPTSNKKLLRYELLDVGAELHARVDFNYYELRDDSGVKWDEYKNIYYFNLDMNNNNTNRARKLELFDEPLTNYTIAIQIDVDKCKGVTQFAEALRKIVVALQKYSGEVKYDEKDQLMSFPPKLAEHFLQRIYTTLTESKLTSICQIGEELDFVETMQNVASTEKLEFVRRKKIIPIEVNTHFFKLLFSLAFRLSLQIERPDLAGKYLKAFGTAYNCIELDNWMKKHSFFQFKINISHEIVEINLPNWKLPDYMQIENMKELRQQKVKRNFDFLLSLSNCAPTFYEILKVAKKLGEIELPKDDAIGELIENDVKKYFDENLINFDKAINLNIDFSPHNELRQIVREIVEEIEQILKNDNWNFAHLNFTKIVEWNLLEYDLHKIGNDQKWEEIEHLRGESQKAYSNWYSEKNEEEKFNYKEMKKLIKVLRGI
uniref:Uncharacterized protein n=1 Tax=Globodera rostochiensis TaxID=31243 RepID=A0A914H8L8_GLORO